MFSVWKKGEMGMTEYEKWNKVIKELEIARKLAWDGEHCNIMDADDALTVSYAITDALALLEAQEAVEPVQDMVGDALFWVCGKCGYDIKSSDWYCAKCGRKVKWE